MKTTSVTYKGHLSDGRVLDPHTGREYPFELGEAFELPPEVAKNLYSQAPDAWEVDKEIEAAVKADIAAEKKAREYLETLEKSPAPVKATESEEA